MTCPVQRIVSGGQSGVDRAALDVALNLGLDCGGWCPRGRRAEDGPIASRYPLVETESAGYPARTRRNVRDSDATLVITWGPASGGTRLTVSTALKQNRPLFVADLECDEAAELARARTWIAEVRPSTLNVAGPRESSRPGAYERAIEFLKALVSTRPGRASPDASR